ncbi:VWA domain-containing protein [bacterium]|nr:VWA domain-containing protein [bacterium]
MDRWSVTFLEPWWLLGLVSLPFVVWLSRRSLAGLGPYRRLVAILCRSTVLALVFFALADIQWVGESRQICTLFLLDQSQSISDAESERALEAISLQISKRPRDRDLAGLIVFGKQARVELPPALYPRDQQLRQVTSNVDRQASDIGAAIQLGLGSLPPNTTGRLVLFTDGNQNRGNAVAQAAIARRNNVPIDVVPIEYRYDAEILVDKVVSPPELRKGDTANLKVVIRSSQPAKGILRLTRVEDGRRQIIAEETVELREGLNVKFVQQTVDVPSLSSYEATFEPDASSTDTLARNNTAAGFTWVRGEGRVLIIAPAQEIITPLLDSLQADKLAVVRRDPSQLSEDLSELAAFDAVMLINVPAETLGEKRQQIIATNTRSLGAGLIMVGGPDSFGPGGYNGSPIEQALPVEMEVKATKLTSKGALVLIMHACEMPEGNFWQKKVAQLAIQQLSAQDECGLLYWNGVASWGFKLQEVGDRQLMNARIDAMVPGDMPDFVGTMQMGYNALRTSEALSKHVIIISDGDPAPPSDSMLNLFRQSKISVSTVAIAAHGKFEEKVMNRIAVLTGGRFYRVTSPRTLPEIYMKETRSVSRPLIFEQPTPWNIRVDYGGEPIAGLADQRDLPPIRGFVMTTPKETAVVEISSPLPAENPRNPIVAHWQYGLGRSVAVTMDAGERWANSWVASGLYGKFWSQLVRWSMRPEASDRLTVSSQEKDGLVRVIVSATSPTGEFLNDLPIESALVKPDGNTEPLLFKQTEPGKYEASYGADDQGTYVVRLSTQGADGSRELAFLPHQISYPPEYRETASRRDLAESVALAAGGRTLEWNQLDRSGLFAEPSRPARHRQEAWPTALLAALVLFLFDVAIRRISIDSKEIVGKSLQAWARWRGRGLEAPIATLDRLRSIKEEVGQELRQRRYTPSTESPGNDSLLASSPKVAPIEPASPSPGLVEEPKANSETDEASHTSRLLRAKRQVWEERDQKKRDDT